MTARIPAPNSAAKPTGDFRHLTLWPASGARYGDGSLAAPRPQVQRPDMADLPPQASPQTQG
ncbi:hypothetical protein [Vannielia sp. SX4]|uniref:hypothetical protein n=1 Tax=Vannielia sp. SX4 TaxID=3463852 RepID=UPI004058E18B